MKEEISIAPSVCKCGRGRMYQTLKLTNTLREMGYKCPNKKWFNFWKHDKDTVHATIPLEK